VKPDPAVELLAAAADEAKADEEAAAEAEAPVEAADAPENPEDKPSRRRGSLARRFQPRRASRGGRTTCAWLVETRL